MRRRAWLSVRMPGRSTVNRPTSSDLHQSRLKTEKTLTLAGLSAHGKQWATWQLERTRVPPQALRQSSISWGCSHARAPRPAVLPERSYCHPREVLRRVLGNDLQRMGEPPLQRQEGRAARSNPAANQVPRGRVFAKRIINLFVNV